MIVIDGSHLTIDKVFSVAVGNEEVKLADPAHHKMLESHKWIQEILKIGKPVYGINTGFGIFSNKDISSEKIAHLNRNLILSHAVGTGAELPHEVVRAAIVIRANTLASGYSGVRPQIVENLLTMLNLGVTPAIPSQGSLGSSGDLAPLSHLALVLTTGEKDRQQDSGWAYYEGQRLDGKTAMEQAGIERVVLGPKEGLAITNGATFSAGLAALIVNQAENLIKTAEVALSMSLEALLGTSAAFDSRLHEIRRQHGQMEVAARVRTLTEGSTLLDAAGRVQDSYSLRCAPQVQGPARDTLNFVAEIINREINAVTDNPLLFGPQEAISGGNFHGEPVGLAMDYLKIAMSEISAISERRIYHLTDGKMNCGLPPMLVDNDDAAGLNSGMMMPQYTAASLVLENQNLAAPDSVLSLPTSGGKEDHNANSMTAARRAYQIIENCAHVLAVEIFCAARALDIRLRDIPDSKLGHGVGQAHQQLREKVTYQPGDSWWGPEIEKVREMIWEGELSI
ncbi:histidine ammonia-lyase [Chloroflexota bacterium]